jgi:hypothetical protein
MLVGVAKVMFFYPGHFYFNFVKRLNHENQNSFNCRDGNIVSVPW